MFLDIELVDGFFGLIGVELGQHDLHGRTVLDLDDIFATGFTGGLPGHLRDVNLSSGGHVGLQIVCKMRVREWPASCGRSGKTLVNF